LKEAIIEARTYEQGLELSREVLDLKPGTDPVCENGDLDDVERVTWPGDHVSIISFGPQFTETKLIQLNEMGDPQIH
jgi:hypothetical protein